MKENIAFQIDRMKRFMDALIENSTPELPAWNIEVVRSGGKAKWNYIDGCMLKAIIEMYYITGEKRYAEFADAYVGAQLKEDGEIPSLNIESENIDNFNGGKVFYDLYAITGKEKYRKGIQWLYDLLMTHPRTVSGSFWHKKIYPDQVWLDGLYMAQPFYMTYETKYNKLANYRDIFMQFERAKMRMTDPETGLLYHGYDESKSIFWCDPETGCSKNFWLRSMGWYVMALVDTLEQMDTQMFFEYRTLMDSLKQAMDALLNFQDESSGMWYQVIDQGRRTGNYLETSGTAMISYAILKGVRLEYLPERYKIYGERAFEGIINQYFEVDDSLGGICLVAGLGGKDRRDGSYEYYISEPVVKNDAKGVAPFLLAFTEIMRAAENGLMIRGR